MSITATELKKNLGKYLTLSATEDVFITKNWNYQSSCKCRNYVFINDDAETVNVYARYYMKNQQNGTQLIFDGENLKTGFAGEIIF